MNIELRPSLDKRKHDELRPSPDKTLNQSIITQQLRGQGKGDHEVFAEFRDGMSTYLSFPFPF